MIHDLSESHNSEKFGKKRYEKKHLEIKVKYIIIRNILLGNKEKSHTFLIIDIVDSNDLENN